MKWLGVVLLGVLGMLLRNLGTKHIFKAAYAQISEFWEQLRQFERSCIVDGGRGDRLVPNPLAIQRKAFNLRAYSRVRVEEGDDGVDTVDLPGN